MIEPLAIGRPGDWVCCKGGGLVVAGDRGGVKPHLITFSVWWLLEMVITVTTSTLTSQRRDRKGGEGGRAGQSQVGRGKERVSRWIRGEEDQGAQGPVLSQGGEVIPRLLWLMGQGRARRAVTGAG